MSWKALEDLLWWFRKKNWSLHNIDVRRITLESLEQAIAIIEKVLREDPWLVIDPTGMSERVRRNRDDFADVVDGLKATEQELIKLQDPTPDAVRDLMQKQIGMLLGLTHWNADSDPRPAREGAAMALLYIRQIQKELVLSHPSG